MTNTPFMHFLAKWSVAILCVAAAARADTAHVLDTRVISPDRSYYSAWGTVGRAPDGTLAVVYSGGREDHVDPFGRIELITSRDGGTTWSWPRVLMDSATDDRDGALFITRKGTWLVGFYTSVAYQKHLARPEWRINKIFGDEAPAHIARSELARQRLTPEQEKADVGHWLLRSTDGGVSWSARLPMPGYSVHGPAEMADGRLLFAGGDGTMSAVWVSDDDGLSWRLAAKLDVRPGETHGVAAADGTWVVQVRDRVILTPGAKPAWATVQMESADEGKTWTKARVITDGFPSHLVLLADGRLVMSYGYRKKPYGIRVRVSADHGRTWGEERVLTADGTSTDLGYPSTVQRDDGTLVTVWYELMAGSKNAVMRQARWKLE